MCFSLVECFHFLISPGSLFTKKGHNFFHMMAYLSFIDKKTDYFAVLKNSDSMRLPINLSYFLFQYYPLCCPQKL